MNVLEKVFGRFGNRMFQAAFCYAYAREHGMDFYYQDPKWFEKYADDIRAMFRPEGEPLDYVAIHIRRGDYIGNVFHVDLTLTDYYQKAMAEFGAHYEFLVFSDDIPWCQQNLHGSNLSFHEGTELEDFSAMARCKHQIIANSSFSWWAAYLNPNPNKIVIAPQAWHPDGVERTICPKEWKRL
jgi:hypothetical protein